MEYSFCTQEIVGASKAHHAPECFPCQGLANIRFLLERSRILLLLVAGSLLLLSLKVFFQVGVPWLVGINEGSLLVGDEDLLPQTCSLIFGHDEVKLGMDRSSA
jgi:hypothetical protein